MACRNGVVEQLGDGRYRKCIGGDWVILPTRPVGPGTGPGALVAIDRAEDLARPEIARAIKDPQRQVILQIIDLTEPQERA